MHKAAPPLLPFPLQGQELLGGFGEPREPTLFNLTLLFAWFGLLWFCSGLGLFPQDGSGWLILQPVASNTNSTLGEGMGQGQGQWSSDK